MPQEIVKQLNFNAGELDPRIDARSDLKTYYAALAYAENVVPLPLGPLVRRPGTVFIDYVRHVAVFVPVVAAFITAPSGGTAADAVTKDGTLFETTADLGAADQVILQVNFGAAVEVHMIDLLDYSVKDPMAAPATPAPFTYPWPQPSGFSFGGGFLGPEVFP